LGLLPHRLRRLLVRIRGNKQRDPLSPLAPYFRNSENVGGAREEDELTEHQARCRPPHSNRNVTIHAPPPNPFTPAALAEVVVELAVGKDQEEPLP